MKSLGAIQCINNKKTTSCAVVSTEENFDEIHDSRSISLSCKITIGTKTSYQHSRKSLESLITQISIIKELLLIFVSDTIGQTNTIIGKRKSRNDGIGLVFQTKKVGLAK